MNRICLVTLLGLPAAGKTTICDHFMQMSTLPFNILHLCYDNFVNFNFDNPKQYKEQRDNVFETLKAVIENFKKSNALPKELNVLKSQYKNFKHKDFIIVCDDNHYYRSMRYKLYQLARHYNIGYCQIYLDCSLELALEQNSLRDRAANVPNEIIVDMFKRLEVPNVLEHKWEENTFIISIPMLNINIYNDIISYIIKLLDKPIQPLQLAAAKSITPQSLVHDLDLLIRKRINNLVIATIETNKNLVAKNLNAKRKDILKQFQLEVENELTENLDLNKYAEMLNL